MSTSRRLTLASQDLIESVAALLASGVVVSGDQRYVDAWQGLDESYRHLRTIMDDLDGDAAASGRDTSIAAAKMRLPAQRSLRRLVLEAIDARWVISGQGMTTEHVERQLRRPHTSVSSAVNYLENHGFLHDSGVRRLNVSKCKAIVYIPTTRAIELMRVKEER